VTDFVVDARGFQVVLWCREESGKVGVWTTPVIGWQIERDPDGSDADMDLVAWCLDGAMPWRAASSPYFLGLCAPGEDPATDHGWITAAETEAEREARTTYRPRT
jgi:hypothetical protein